MYYIIISVVKHKNIWYLFKKIKQKRTYSFLRSIRIGIVCEVSSSKINWQIYINCDVIWVISLYVYVIYFIIYTNTRRLVIKILLILSIILILFYLIYLINNYYSYTWILFIPIKSVQFQIHNKRQLWFSFS